MSERKDRLLSPGPSRSPLKSIGIVIVGLTLTVGFPPVLPLPVPHDPASLFFEIVCLT
jgi:hypothetical protein